MRRVGVVGSGYVGTVVAACFADIGHSVVALEMDEQKVEALSSGLLPFHEPELGELLRSGLRSGNLRFTSHVDDAVAASDVIFLCVGTPSAPSGRPDLSALEAALRGVARAADAPKVLVTKSTVPVGTGNWVASVVDDEMARRDDPPVPFSVVSNPEFLREGLAVHDFLNPDRVVVGSDDPEALDTVASLYAPILDGATVRDDSDHPVLLRTALCAAEMIKYASNAFLATKISFANEIANICERVGADVGDVTQAIGLDTRIGSKFLDAGVGWGGSCFGKDLSALVTTAHELGYDATLLDAAVTVNRQQRTQVVEKLQRHLGALLGRRVALLGLAFKPGTDDIRDAPAVEIARLLLEVGASVRAHDPVVRAIPGLPGLVIDADPYVAASRADAVVLVTEWPEYQVMDLDRLRDTMRGDLFVDGRNAFTPAHLRGAGFRPVSFGRLDHRAPVERRSSMSGSQG
ncbi:MAG TPA: UDP-glucose/GDP-mannose dehydrogenase family protein [Acidimicrobiales bacterium]